MYMYIYTEKEYSSFKDMFIHNNLKMRLYSVKQIHLLARRNFILFRREMYSYY